MGLGEVFVFIFFGLVATAGPTYTQVGSVPAAAWAGSVVMGLLACAVLVCNNVRDLPRDAQSGKITLSVRLGDRGSRLFYVALVIFALVALGVVVAATSPWALIGLFIPGILLLPACRQIMAGTTGMELVKVLKRTSVAELTAGAGVFIGVLIAMVM